jgi:hypothetical protein
MNPTSTRLLMTASAAVMAAAGIAGSFLPDEILAGLGVARGGPSTTIMQVLASLWLAAAMTNWMARGNAFGGIYGRPIAVGNLTHFAIGGITLAKMVAGGGAPLPLVVAAVVYTVFAAAFAVVMFSAGPVSGSPRMPTSPPLPPIR